MSFSISDAFSRIVLTGTCKNVFDYTANPLGSNVVTAAWSNGSTALKGYSVTGITLTAPVVLSANYYDDYEFLGRMVFLMMQRPVIQKCPVTVKDIPVVVKVN